jgi:hypothetical protein
LNPRTLNHNLLVLQNPPVAVQNGAGFKHQRLRESGNASRQQKKTEPHAKNCTSAGNPLRLSGKWKADRDSNLVTRRSREE